MLLPIVVQLCEGRGPLKRGRQSLDEMRNLMPDPAQRTDNHGRLLESLQRKVTEIDALQQRLAQNRARGLEIIAGIEGKPEGMGCEENAQRMLVGWWRPGGKGANEAER